MCFDQNLIEHENLKIELNIEHSKCDLVKKDKQAKGQFWTGREPAQGDILTGTCDSFNCMLSPKEEKSVRQSKFFNGSQGSMLSARASCLETHAFFRRVNVTSFLLFKEREREEQREKKEKAGGGRRSARPDTGQAEFRKIA